MSTAGAPSSIGAAGSALTGATPWGAAFQAAGAAAAGGPSNAETGDVSAGVQVGGITFGNSGGGGGWQQLAIIGAIIFGGVMLVKALK
jgi:hypothetical protein